MKIVWAVLFMCLISEARVYAQVGNDFPGGFWVPSPSWSPVPVLTPVPGVGWSGGMATQQYPVINRVGDKVRLDVVLDYWQLGPLQLVLRSTGGSDVHWVEGEGAGGQWRGWCIRCTLEFTATEPNVLVWMEYAGSPAFTTHLENFQVTTRRLSIMPDWSKQTYHNIGNGLNGLAAGLGIGATIALAYGDALTAGIATSTGVVSGFVGSLLLQVDPWDDWYAYPVDPVYQSPGELGLTYLDSGYGVPFWDTVTYWNNVFINSGVNMSATLKAANISIDRAFSCDQIGDSCAEWQAERARLFFEAANENAYWAAIASWIIADQYQQNGIGPDYVDQWNAVAGQFWAMHTNSVR